jgi:hypothetical protein
MTVMELALDAIDRFLESHYRLNPVDATFAGVHSHDHRMPDWSPEGLDRAVGELLMLRATLADELSGGRTLSPSMTVGDMDRMLADASLEIRIAELSGSHCYRGNPSLWAGEAIFGVIALMIRDFAPPRGARALGSHAHGRYRRLSRAGNRQRTRCASGMDHTRTAGM